MKSAPHDLYLKHMDQDILDDILKFHVKGNFIFDSLTRHATALHFCSTRLLEQLTGNELALSVDSAAPQEKYTIPLHPIAPQLVRADSCEIFRVSKLSLSDIDVLVQPFLKKEDGGHRRGYPSGGALYPIEVFIFDMSHPANSSDAVLHLLPHSRTYESVDVDPSALRAALLPKGSNIGTPALAVIYISYQPKNLFKYRHRGYRLALMEVGSMYMLLDLHCKQLGLVNRVWSAFSDHAVTRSLNLNPAFFLPLGVQLIGVK